MTGWEKRKEERWDSGSNVGKMPKCISRLFFSDASTRQQRNDGGIGGGQGGWWERVLLKAVKGTDKEISFVILSGGGKKKERDSDFEDVLPPYNQRGRGKRKSSGKTERHLKMFPGFTFYECRGERQGNRQSITDGVELVASLIIRGGEKVVWAQKGTTHGERKREMLRLQTIPHFPQSPPKILEKIRTNQCVWYFLSPCNSLSIQNEPSSFLKQLGIVVFGANSTFVGDKVFSRRM